MKKLLTILISIILLVACSEEPPLETFSAEAFAYEIDNGWELNASINVKGFRQIEKDDIYHTNLKYIVDFITPEQDTLKEFDFGSIIKQEKEELLDVTIEVQAEIDSNYSPGKYLLIYTVFDKNSDRDTTTVKPFILEK